MLQTTQTKQQNNSEIIQSDATAHNELANICLQKITFNDVSNTSIGDLSKISVSELYELKAQALEVYKKAEWCKEWLDKAIIQKYADKFVDKRIEQNKQYGVINLHDDNFQIAEDRPKKVDWKQDELKNIYQAIISNQGDPDEYIKVSFSVSEEKYKNWPEHVKSSFRNARSLSYGKPKITIKKTISEINTPLDGYSYQPLPHGNSINVEV